MNEDDWKAEKNVANQIMHLQSHLLACSKAPLDERDRWAWGRKIVKYLLEGTREGNLIYLLD